MAIETKVFYTVYNETFFLFVTGLAKFTIGEKLNKAFDIFLNESKGKKFVLDLVNVNLIDSTCLGIIAKKGMKVLKKIDSKPVVYFTHYAIKSTLEDVGLDKIYDFQEIDLENEYNLLKQAKDNNTEVESKNMDDKSMKLLIYEAHKFLSELTEDNAKKFKGLIEILEKDL